MKWKDILCLDLSLMMIFGRHSLMQLHALTSVCRQRGFGFKNFLMHIFHQIIKEREVNGSLNFKNQLDRRHQLISLIESCLEGILITQVLIILFKNNKDSRQKVSI